MKQKRHFKIREIIKEKPIETQEELAAELRKQALTSPRQQYLGILKN